MGTIVKNYTFASGATIFASEINSNFDTVYNLINGNIDNDNLDTNAAIAGSKVDLSSSGPIGGTTPSTSSFTTLLVSGNITLSGAVQSGVLLEESAGATTGADQGSYHVANNGSESRPYFKTESDGTSYEISIIGADGYIEDELVDTTALKVATGEVSTTATAELLTLPGGQYGHYPNFKPSTSGVSMTCTFLTNTTVNTTDYTSWIVLGISPGYTGYARSTYHTASGLDQWIFIIKRADGSESWYKADDHPSYGRRLDVATPCEKLEGDEVFCIEKSSAMAVKKLSLQEIQNNYEIGEEAPYVPMHQGSFIIKDGKRVPVIIAELPDYVKCVKLNKKVV